MFQIIVAMSIAYTLYRIFRTIYEFQCSMNPVSYDVDHGTDTIAVHTYKV